MENIAFDKFGPSPPRDESIVNSRRRVIERRLSSGKWKYDSLDESAQVVGEIDSIVSPACKEARDLESKAVVYQRIQEYYSREASFDGNISTTPIKGNAVSTIQRRFSFDRSLSLDSNKGTVSQKLLPDSATTHVAVPMRRPIDVSANRTDEPSEAEKALAITRQVALESMSSSEDNVIPHKRNSINIITEETCPGLAIALESSIVSNRRRVIERRLSSGNLESSEIPKPDEGGSKSVSKDISQTEKFSIVKQRLREIERRASLAISGNAANISKPERTPGNGLVAQRRNSYTASNAAVGSWLEFKPQSNTSITTKREMQCIDASAFEPNESERAEIERARLLYEQDAKNYNNVYNSQQYSSSSLDSYPARNNLVDDRLRDLEAKVAGNYSLWATESQDPSSASFESSDSLSYLKPFLPTVVVRNDDVAVTTITSSSISASDDSVDILSLIASTKNTTPAVPTLDDFADEEEDEEAEDEPEDWNDAMQPASNPIGEALIDCLSYEDMIEDTNSAANEEQAAILEDEEEGFPIINDDSDVASSVVIEAENIKEIMQLMSNYFDENQGNAMAASPTQDSPKDENYNANDQVVGEATQSSENDTGTAEESFESASISMNSKEISEHPFDMKKVHLEFSQPTEIIVVRQVPEPAFLDKRLSSKDSFKVQTDNEGMDDDDDDNNGGDDDESKEDRNAMQQEYLNDSRVVTPSCEVQQQQPRIPPSPELKAPLMQIQVPQPHRRAYCYIATARRVPVKKEILSAPLSTNAVMSMEHTCLCSSCGTPSIATAKFCGECGKPMQTRDTTISDQKGGEFGINESLSVSSNSAVGYQKPLSRSYQYQLQARNGIVHPDQLSTWVQVGNHPVLINTQEKKYSDDVPASAKEFLEESQADNLRMGSESSCNFGSIFDTLLRAAGGDIGFGMSNYFSNSTTQSPASAELDTTRRQSSNIVSSSSSSSALQVAVAPIPAVVNNDLMSPVSSITSTSRAPSPEPSNNITIQQRPRTFSGSDSNHIAAKPRPQEQQYQFQHQARISINQQPGIAFDPSTQTNRIRGSQQSKKQLSSGTFDISSNSRSAVPIPPTVQYLPSSHENGIAPGLAGRNSAQIQHSTAVPQYRQQPGGLSHYSR